MKTVSVVIPTRNEEENVVLLSETIVRLFAEELPAYDYEIIFIDNYSTDNTRQLLRGLCAGNQKIKAIFNARNFGPWCSPVYALQQASGDCAALLTADFQDPPELIPLMVREWEKGYKIIAPVKTRSRENKIMRFLRNCYYKAIRKMSDIQQIDNFTGIGLYDKSFIEIVRSLNDPQPFLRSLVPELGYKIKTIPFEQQKRRAGKSKFNFYRLYDGAMISVTSYTKIGLRVATIVGFIASAASLIISLVYLIMKLTHWASFPMGLAPAIIGVYFIGSLQLFFIGFIGEYIMSINTRVMNRPLVIEEERINFENS